MILGILFLVFLVCLFLILFSIKFYISGEAESQKILYDQKEAVFKESNIQAFEDEVKNYNKVISEISSFCQNQFSPTEILEKISKTLPSDVYATNVSIKRQQEKGGEEKIICSLQGFAPTRDNLLVLKANLEKEEIFESINFPPSSWIEAKDINFSVNFQIKWQ